MSILENLFNGILGKTEETESSSKPCTNCSSSCAVCPDACEECRPLKERLIELLYDVEHLDAFYDRYEVVSGLDTDAGTSVCPFCGGVNPASAVSCDFCGSQLRESGGKIRVASAKDIPNPILQAQDVIFQRQDILKKYTQSESTGLLDALSDLLDGGSADTFGDRMTEDEIRATAEAYGVSVAAYLQGLDNGTYLTASAKKKQAEAGNTAFAGPSMMGAYSVGHGGRQDMPGPRPGAAQYRPDHGSRPPMQQRPPVQQGRPGGQRPGGAQGGHAGHGGGRPGGGRGSGRGQR